MAATAAPPPEDWRSRLGKLYDRQPFGLLETLVDEFTMTAQLNEIENDDRATNPKPPTHDALGSTTSAQ